ncbi:MAG TPA: DUF3618 domain-containing protein [Sphingomicrobium sp.]|nr:DUF3618 domain-containing protein [Sphingomicrobium sp.]
MSDDDIKAAEFRVDRARSKMIGTLQELSQQLQPHRLMEEAWEKAKDKGADLAENAVDAVRARPVAATGVVAAITMFLAREPLMDLAGKLIGAAKGKKRARRKAPQREKTEAAE